jgi:hypothetical protein
MGSNHMNITCSWKKKGGLKMVKSWNKMGIAHVYLSTLLFICDFTGKKVCQL